MKKIGVAILGLGVVGGGTYKLLTEKADFYRKTQGLDLVVESVLESDPQRTAALGIPSDKIACNIAEAVLNPDVNVVVECIGGTDPAKEYVLAALHAGKTVVTSNKELIAKEFFALEHAAKSHNAGLYFEASCVGGVPVIRALTDGVQSNTITSVKGIINGTTNYILTKMTETGATYEEALEDARKLGIAEADPTADVEGYDAAYKLSILSSLAFHAKVPYTKIFREGITGISAEDIADGNALGYRLKLLAIAKRTDAGIEARVHPAFVRKDHPLASVEGSYNAVFLTGDCVGDLMLYGRGAGELPTASAVVSDIIFAATRGEHRYSHLKSGAHAEKESFSDDFESAFYLRLTVNDEPGVLAKISSVLGKYGVSVEELIQRAERDRPGKATLVLITHKTHELSVKKAVKKLSDSDHASVDSVLRVEL